VDHEDERELVEPGVFGREVTSGRQGLPVAFRFSREAGEVEIAEVRIS
jgi:hypothetical protein